MLNKVKSFVSDPYVKYQAKEIAKQVAIGVAVIVTVSVVKSAVILANNKIVGATGKGTFHTLYTYQDDGETVHVYGI